ERSQPGIERLQAGVHVGDPPGRTRMTLEECGIEHEDAGDGTSPAGLGEGRVVVHAQIAGEPVQTRGGHTRGRPQATSAFKTLRQRVWQAAQASEPTPMTVGSFDGSASRKSATRSATVETRSSSAERNGYGRVPPPESASARPYHIAAASASPPLA